MPGDPTDYLYIILGKDQYYRLSRAQIVTPANAIPSSEADLVDYLEDLSEKNAIIADIESAPGESNDSCVCIALNVGYLDLDKKSAIRLGQEKSAARKAAKKKARKDSRKTTPPKTAKKTGKRRAKRG